MTLSDTAPFNIELDHDWQILLRPINPSDVERAERAYAMLSERSRKNRFLRNAPHLGFELAHRLSGTGPHEHHGWIALPVEETIDLPGYGAASIWPDPADNEQAEFSITILDSWQRRGIGVLLLSILWFEGWGMGIRRFTGIARLENAEICNWWENVGGTVTIGKHAHELVLDIEDPAAFHIRIGNDLHARTLQVELANWFGHWIGRLGEPSES